MPKIDCEIIGDLLPLYIDGICSEKTAECIEQHLSECENCASLLKKQKEALPELSAVEPDVDEAVKSAGKRIKKGKKKAVLKATAVMLLLVLIAGITAFIKIPLNNAVNNYTVSGYMNSEMSSEEFSISNTESPNYSSKAASVHLDKNLGQYSAEEKANGSTLTFSDGKKIVIMRTASDDGIKEESFISGYSFKFAPFLSTDLFLMPVIKKGADNLGLDIEAVSSDNLDLYIGLVRAGKNFDFNTEGRYAAMCAYYSLFTTSMPLVTNGYYITAENSNCKAFGYSMINESGTNYYLQFQNKNATDNSSELCYISFCGFTKDEVKAVIESFVMK